MTIMQNVHHGGDMNAFCFVSALTLYGTIVSIVTFKK